MSVIWTQHCREERVKYGEGRGDYRQFGEGDHTVTESNWFHPATCNIFPQTERSLFKCLTCEGNTRHQRKYGLDLNSRRLLFHIPHFIIQRVIHKCMALCNSKGQQTDGMFPSWPGHLGTFGDRNVLSTVTSLFWQSVQANKLYLVVITGATSWQRTRQGLKEVLL